MKPGFGSGGKSCDEEIRRACRHVRFRGRRRGEYFLSAFDFPASDQKFHCQRGNSSSPRWYGFNLVMVLTFF